MILEVDHTNEYIHLCVGTLSYIVNAHGYTVQSNRQFLLNGVLAQKPDATVRASSTRFKLCPATS